MLAFEELPPARAACRTHGSTSVPPDSGGSNVDRSKHFQLGSEKSLASGEVDRVVTSVMLTLAADCGRMTALRKKDPPDEYSHYLWLESRRFSLQAPARNAKMDWNCADSADREGFGVSQ